MLKPFLKFLAALFLWAGALYTINVLLMQFYLAPLGYNPPIMPWHIFIAILTLVSGFAVLAVSRWRFHYTGFAFMAAMLLKIAAAIVYLWPLLQASGEPPIAHIMHFMALYFLYLIFEAAFVLRYLNRTSPPQ